MTRQHWDVLVIGAGPAGMAAAVAASSQGARVAVIDDNADSGGQIWRRGLDDQTGRTDKVQARTRRAFANSGATLLSGRRVIAASVPGSVDTWHDGEEQTERYFYHRLVLATGARELFLPFPGWTLLGVYGAGGLQALVRGGYSIRGKRVLVAGTGPLLLAVAAHLREDGAQVLGVCEQAGMRQMLPFGVRLWNRPAKLLQAAGLLRQLASIPYRRSCWPIAAHGDGHLEAVELTDGRRRWIEPCDLLACGFHLIPNAELALLLGCRTESGSVVVDASQRTSVPNIYCAGEPTGIAGVDAALVEGAVAGYAAAGAERHAAKLKRQAQAERAFGAAMDRAFRLRKELRSLPDAETIICRCEDVRYEQLKALAAQGESWTGAKLQTRCGMGSCQGRICGPALQTFFGWTNTSIRPPLFPLPLAALASQMHDAVELNPSRTQETL